MDGFEYEIIRSDRKTIAFVVEPDGRLIVRAPRNIKRSRIEEFINDKKDWIINKQYEALEILKKYRPIEVENGKSILYLGDSLIIEKKAVSEIRIVGSNIFIPEDREKKEIAEWLKEEARIIITDRVLHYSEIMDVKPYAVKISEAKRRWGSCSYKNSLNFAWRLIMCPMEVIDYVVVHELCHIRHKDHSGSFWKSVEAVYHDYKAMNDWLTLNRGIMEII